MSCSSSDDDEFVSSVYNKAAVKSNYNKNLKDLIQQCKKPTGNLKLDKEKVEEDSPKEIEVIKPSCNDVAKKSQTIQEKRRSVSTDTPQSEEDTGEKSPDRSEDDNSSDIIVENVLEKESNDRDMLEVVHEHVLSQPPAYSTRSSKRLRNELEQQRKPPILPKRKKSVRKKRGKTIVDYFRGEEKKLQDTVIELESDVFVISDCEEAKECSDEEINSEVSVKIIWKSVHIKKFQVRKFQKFLKIFEILTDEEKVPIEKIYLTFKGVRIKPNDTPESLNLKIYDFIEGGILSETSNNLDVSVNNSKNNIGDDDNDDDSVVNIKFQDNKKNVVKLKLKNTDKMKIVMLKYAEQIDVPLDKIKFLFEGELIDPNQTPNDLELCSDEVIDVKF